MKAAFRLIAAALCVALLCATVSPAENATDPLSCNLQVSLLGKVLSFDRSLLGRKELVVAVVYQAEYPASEAEKEKFMRSARAGVSVGGVQLRFKPVSLKGKPDFRDIFTAVGADIAYVMPVRGLSVEHLARAAAAAGARTFSGVPNYVYDGISVTFGAKDQRPAVYVNLQSARAQGSDFSSQLLKLANVVD